MAGEIVTTLARCIAAKHLAERERDEARRQVLELREQLEKLTAAQTLKSTWEANPSEN